MPARLTPGAGTARALLLVLALAVAAGSVDRLARVVAMLRDSSLATVLLDLTPVRARIDAAIAAVVAGDVDALIRDALAADDPERARALAAAALRHGRPLAPETTAALAAAATMLSRAAHQARDLGRAVTGGAIRTGAGLAAAAAFELSPAADVRDLAREGSRALAGAEPDRLLLGLSALGLAAATAGVVQPAAAGAALAGKAGLKLLLRGGRLAPGLAQDLRRALRAGGDPARLAGAAARGADGARLVRAAEALGAITATHGPRTALLAAGSARSLDDLPALARVARELGAGADDAFRILGQAAAPALRLGRAAAWLAGEIATLALALLSALAGMVLALPRRIVVARLRRRAARPRVPG